MDLELGIQLEQGPGERSLSFEVKDYRPEGDSPQFQFEPITLTENPKAFFADLYRRVEGLPKDEGLSAEDVLEELQDYGSYLYHQLLPPELGRFLERHQGCSLQIHSTEPWIPWEWVRLERAEEGHRLPGPFLCEAFDLSRWLAGRPQPLTLPVAKMALVAWGRSRNLDLQGEVAFLEGLRGADRQVRLIEPRLRTLRAALASGEFDSLHFCGHGDAPDRADHAELHLEDHTRFTPVNLQGAARNLGRGQPLVFLNACRTARGGFSLTGLGGWAGHFLAAGAGAFIGTHWTVSNSKAEVFSQHFYLAFLKGAPIAHAFRAARNAIREPGNPSWLAYTLYAHPEARYLPRASETSPQPFRTGLPSFQKPTDPILEMRSPRWPGDPSNASSLLNADYRVVPFHGRNQELEKLRKWCLGGAADCQILLYTGPGGMGKSRLAMEACESLGEGWRAGFIRRNILDLDVDPHQLKQTVWPRLTQGTRPVFMVMDYSETHHAKLVSLLEVIAAPRGPRLRLLLLSREAGDWWYGLKRQRGIVGNLLRGQRARHDSLGPLASSLADREQSYRTAAKAFAAKLDKPVQGPPPSALDDSCFDRVLLLHMMALASVEGVRLKARDSDDGVLDYILDRERRLWENQLAARGLPQTFHKGLGQVLAEVYSRGGVGSRQEALTIFRQLPFFEGRPADLLDEAATLLHECYPGEDCWIEAIQPDLLGEHLIMREHSSMGKAITDDIFGPV